MHPEQNYSAPNNPSDYDFIVNPQTPQKRTSMPTGSMTSRILVVLVGLVILVVGFTVVKNIISGPPQNTVAMRAVLAQQQELIHLTANPLLTQAGLSSSNQNLAITTDLSLTSDQAKLLTYLRSQGQKVVPKQIIYPGAKALDDQIAASIAASTLDTTFSQVLKTQLTDYKQSLKTAFDKTKGTKGRELLTEQYNSANLLLSQTEPAPASTVL